MANFAAGLATVVVLFFCIEFVSSDLASDRQECTDQLIGLSPCLSYVQPSSTSKVPTPDCCTGLKQVLSKSTKCLCLLIKYRNDPQLGLKVDINKALILPSQCSASANIGECPKLLNLPADSQEAKEFKQFASTLKGNSTSSGNGKASSVNSTASTGTPAPANGVKGRSLTVKEMIFGLWISLLTLML